jgi:hypothetical protein
MEYVSGGSLFDKVASHGRFSEVNAALFLKQGEFIEYNLEDKIMKP